VGRRQRRLAALWLLRGWESDGSNSGLEIEQG